MGFRERGTLPRTSKCASRLPDEMKGHRAALLSELKIRGKWNFPRYSHFLSSPISFPLSVLNNAPALCLRLSFSSRSLACPRIALSLLRHQLQPPRPRFQRQGLQCRYSRRLGILYAVFPITFPLDFTSRLTLPSCSHYRDGHHSFRSSVSPFSHDVASRTRELSLMTALSMA